MKNNYENLTIQKIDILHKAYFQISEMQKKNPILITVMKNNCDENNTKTHILR